MYESRAGGMGNYAYGGYGSTGTQAGGGGALFQPMPKPKIWENASFSAEFCDGFADDLGTSVETYDSILLFSDLLKYVLPRAKDVDARSEMPIITILKAVEKADLLYRRLQNYLNWGIQFHLTKIIDDICKNLLTMVEGDHLILPLFTGDDDLGVMYVMYNDVKTFDIYVVNASPFNNYHPKKAIPPKIKMVAALHMKRISREKLCSEAFWACVMLGASLPDNVMYTHFLEWLSGSTFEGQIADGMTQAIYTTPCKSSRSVFWKGLITVFKESLRSQGISVEKTKLIRLLLKQRMLELVSDDLNEVKSIKLSQRRLIETAGQNAALAVTRNGANLTPSQMEDARHIIDVLQGKLQNLPCDDDSTTQPPPVLDLITGWNLCQQLDHFPLMESLRRLESVDHFAGAVVEQPHFVPTNFLNFPQHVTSMEEIIRVLDTCVNLITRIVSQDTVIKRIPLLVSSLISHTVIEVLPMPLGPKSRNDRECVWANRIRSGQQLHIMMRLNQLTEYFAAAAFSMASLKEYDGTRITVIGKIAVMSDIIMRQPATDRPNLISNHLKGYKGKPGFAPGPGKYATQTETIMMITPEVLHARTEILDYYSELHEDIPQSHILWKWEESMKECKATNIMMKQICQCEALSSRDYGYYVAGAKESQFCVLCKYHPEFKYYRDINFYFKYFMQTNPAMFPSMSNHIKQWAAELQWNFYEGDGYHVEAFGNNLVCRATGQRWPSFALATRWTFPYEANCEDDILHIKSLPTFGEVLGQRDAELLLSYLTAPYLRIPLVLRFLATEDRISGLRSGEVQALLESVLFEPSRFLSRDLSKVCPEMVPTENQALISTPYGLLLNELQFSSEGVVEPLLRLVELAQEMDAGTVHNKATVDVILFLVRIVARVENFMVYLLEREVKSPQEKWMMPPLRDVEFTSDSLVTLMQAHARLRKMINDAMLPMLETWVNEVMGDAGTADMNEDIDNATRIASRLYAHIILLQRNISPRDFTEDNVSQILSAMMFLTTRHTWNSRALDVAETEIFEIMQRHRRNIVGWMYLQKEPMPNVLDAVVRVATSSGRRGGVATHGWGYIAGPDCIGRFTRVDEEMLKRPEKEKATAALLENFVANIGIKKGVDGVAYIPDGSQDVEINLQTWSLTFKAAHLTALPSSIANDSDVFNVFATAIGGKKALLQSMQCAVVEEADNRSWVRLVGQDHDVQWWKSRDPRFPIPGDMMRFYPDDLIEDEKWLVPLIEPIKKCYFERSFWEPPIFILLPDTPLTATQSVAHMCAVDSRSGRKLKEIVVFRDHACTHTYDVFSHGRRYYRSLMYSSDARFCMRSLQPATDNRQAPWSSWARHEAGDPNPDMTIGEDSNCIIFRHASHPTNISKSTETFLPHRLLHGLLPDCLLEAHEFWQDVDDNVRGYPIAKEGEEQKPMHILWIHWRDIEFEAIGTKNTCARVFRFARARSAPRASEQAVFRSQQVELPNETEEEVEMTRAISSCPEIHTENADLMEGAYRQASYTYTPAKESATIEDYNLLLVDLLYARKGTPLYSLTNVVTRLEPLSHVVAWTSQTDYKVEEGGAVTLDLVQFPRLKLSFCAKVDGDGHLQLYSMDHSHLFVCNLRQPLVNRLLQGMPHSILLCDANQAVSILVPSFSVVRPAIMTAPFSTELIIDRSDVGWYAHLDTRYYLYPIHVSLSFMFTPTLASALYVLLLRFLHRDYDDVYRLAGSIGTDMEFTKEEKQIFDRVGRVRDSHPNAHACRAKIGLLTADSPVSCGWYLPFETANAIAKNSLITVACRLPAFEERRLLHICHQLELKMAVIREVAMSHGEALKLVLDRIRHATSILSGTLQERRLIRAFLKALNLQLREKLDVRIANDELSRMLSLFDFYARDPMAEYFRCLLHNRRSFIEAEAKSIETGESPITADMKVPAIGKDLQWNLYRDFNAMVVKPPGGVSALKNDEGRAVTMSKTADFYYCGQSVRKANACKCHNCNEYCGPDNGCPCASCERFNKSDGPTLRQLPAELNYDRSFRMLSFFDTFQWIAGVFGKYSSSLSKKADEQHLHRATIWEQTNSFLRYYELMTGTTKVRVAYDDCAKDLPALLFPFSREAQRQSSGLGHFMHFLLANPKSWGSLPKWNRASKQKISTRLMLIYNGIFEQAAVHRELPADPASFPTIEKPPATLSIVPRPDVRTLDIPLYKTRILPSISNTDCNKRTLGLPIVGDLNLVGDDERALAFSEVELKELVTTPLKSLGVDELVVFMSRKELQLPLLPAELPFDLSNHPAAKTTVAKQMMSRMTTDMNDFATNANDSKAPKLKMLLSETVVRELTNGGNSAHLHEIIAELNALRSKLTALRDTDTNFTGRALPVIQRTANHLEISKDSAEAITLYLRRLGGQEATLSLDYLISSLCSTKCEEDWQKLNPFLTAKTSTALVNMIAVSVLRANRIGHINRACEAVEGLVHLLQRISRPPPNFDDATLHSLQDALVASIVQKADTCASILATKRVYVDSNMQFDPRYMLFEFTWNITLRSRQIELIGDMHSNLCNNKSLVKQMIMGAGKTTVVGPLLALMLADGNTLVIQVVPAALLDFTRSVLRATFSSILQKQIFSFVCDRSSDVDSEVISKFQHARQSRGIIVTTPSSIKSIFLKYIEGLDRIEDTSRPQSSMLEKEVDDIGRLMPLWRDGVLIMDEVDLLLHPLKSELNFPVGAKHDIDYAPLRWRLPIHLIDAFFYFHTRRISVPLKESPESQEVLQNFAECVRHGLTNNSLQNTPHLVLLNHDYYHNSMKPLLAKWLMFFLKAHHFTGLSEEETMTYMTVRPDPRNEPELAKRVGALEETFIKMLNLSYEWLNCYLPHAIQKIDRVAFGIMNNDDMKRAREEHPNMPRSRYVTAIPFVGKDLPSQSSEFAHPDVVIGLTIFSYRYEGLRNSDFTDIMREVHLQVEKEVGRFSQRRTNIMYMKWVKAGGGRILSTFDYKGAQEGGAPKEDELGMQPSESMVYHEDGDEAHETTDVLPLRLMKQANTDESEKLFKLLRRTPEVIHWYLCESIFPEYMRHQRLKLSSSGQELGGDMLFARRVGFSGTPSDLLPMEMGRCGYEPCTDGKLVHTLTSPEIISYEIMESGWTVRSLLDWVANASPPFHALVDTGALITGLSNLQVAQYLLKHGLTQMEGVVFLDEWDRKMILVRSTGRVLKLAECGIPKLKRFAFYDQVHTTGMDIDHTPNAQCVLTLGKDMTFRDYSQGAYRMRGISQGQTVCLMIIPEVYDLMMRSLEATRKEKIAVDALSRPKADVLNDVTAWLLVNSIQSEHVQHNQLCLQSVSNVWRKSAYKSLVEATQRGEFKVGTRPSDAAIRALGVYREKVEFAVYDKVPQPRMFSEAVASYVQAHKEFIDTEDGAKLVEIIRKQTLLEDEEDNPVIDVQMVQEQEEEREQEQEQEKEQEIEIEKYVDLAYSRDEERPDQWKLETLFSVPRCAQFYKLSEFHLYKRHPLAFPDNIMLSRNFFNPRWGGHRRLKNVIVTMEWIPNVSELGIREYPSRDYGEIEEGIALPLLTRTTELIKNHQGDLGPELVGDLLRIALNNVDEHDPQWNDTVKCIVEANGQLTPVLLQQLKSNRLRREEHGRYTVAVALCEAETLRRVLHLRKTTKSSILPGHNVEFALRIAPSSNAVIDCSNGFRHATSVYQAAKSHQCLRFFDSDLHFADADIGLLLRAMHCSPVKLRQAFFQQVIACRRRCRQRWDQTPVALLFNLTSAFTLLHQRSVGLCLRRDLSEKDLYLGDAFLAFNSSHSGVLSPDEVWGAMRYCRLDVSADDVLDFIEIADTQHEGTIQYPDFLSMLTGKRELDDDSGEPNSDDVQGKKLPAVPPHGADMIRSVKAERERLLRAAEKEANQETAAEDERVMAEIEMEQDREELAVATSAENPCMKNDQLHYSYQQDELPQLCTTYGKVTRTVVDEAKQHMLKSNSGLRLSLRALKPLIGGAMLQDYTFSIEFALPKPNKTVSTLDALANCSSEMHLLSWPILWWRLKGDDDPIPVFQDETEIDRQGTMDMDRAQTTTVSVAEEEHEAVDATAFKIFSEPKLLENLIVGQVPVGNLVEEFYGKRHMCLVEGVTYEWMRITSPKEGWVISERSGKPLWTQMQLCVTFTQTGGLRITRSGKDDVADQEAVVQLDDDDDDELKAEEEEADFDDCLVGDVLDLIEAIKKAKKLKVGDKVRRNPEHWEHGNDDGGDGKVGKVIKVDEEEVTVQWPSGNKGDYEWGRQGKFCLIKVADAVEGEDEEGEDRDTYNDERWMGDITKKKNCEECGKKKMELGDWYRCNQCDNFNLCKKCFRSGIHNEHDFTDMGALAAPQGNDLVVGQWVRIKESVVEPRNGWQEVDRTMKGILKMIEDDDSLVVDYPQHNSAWIGYVDEVEQCDAPAEEAAVVVTILPTWLHVMEGDLGEVGAYVAGIGKQNVYIPKAGDRVIAKRSGNAYPGEVRAVVGSTCVINYEDDEVQHDVPISSVKPFAFKTGSRVRFKRHITSPYWGCGSVDVRRSIGAIQWMYGGCHSDGVQAYVRFSEQCLYVLTSELDVIGTGKWSFKNAEGEVVPFTTSSNVIVERAFSEGITKVEVFVKDGMYTLRFDTMQMTNMQDESRVLTILRDPAEEFVPRIPPKKFDDGHWHIMTIAVRGREAKAYCDGQTCPVDITAVIEDKPAGPPAKKSSDGTTDAEAANVATKEFEEAEAKKKKEAGNSPFAIDLRKPVITLGASVNVSAVQSYNADLARQLPKRQVTWSRFEWGTTSTEETIVAWHKQIDDATKWKCSECHEMNSRLLAQCVCGKDRVKKEKKDDGPKDKVRSAGARSRQAQQVRQRLQGKLRSKYQQELDEIDEGAQQQQGVVRPSSAAVTFSMSPSPGRPM